MSWGLDVSIIIVNYNTKELTRNCLKSVFEQTKDISFEVIVSDNGSTDGSIEMIKFEFPSVVLIENNANLGFGAANNRGLSIAKGKYIFYLNSDTLLLNNAAKIFFDYWENSEDKDKIGALGGILLDKDLKEIHSGAKFPTYSSICKEQTQKFFLHIFKSICKLCYLKMIYRKVAEKHTVHSFICLDKIEYVTGADLFLKNNSGAYFDEEFFLYYEETDLQLRLIEKNLFCKIVPEVRIIHLTKKIDNDFSISTFSDICNQVSAIKYVKKNLKLRAFFLYFLIRIDWLNPFIKKNVKKVRGIYHL